MAQLLMDADLPPEQKEDVVVLKDSAESLLTLLNDILDLSKIEAGQMSLREDDFDLQALIKQVLQLARGNAEGKGLALTLELDEAVPQWQYGDAVRLRQVLSNLVGNAVKFTDHGSITLYAGVDPNNDKNLLLTVADTGVGIAAEQQERIFDEFAQADESSTRRAEGTGLGLAICQRLVGMMGGRLWLESEFGKGSRFSFSIPLQAPKAAHGPAKTQVAEGDDMPPLKVLVVEDNAVNRLLMEKSLARMGHETTMAMNGREALELTGEQDFDVVLMDLQMPEMDGFEATQKIMQATNNQAWILGVTASVTTETVEQCEAVGMRAVLPKPVLLPDLRQRLNEAWQAQQAES
ncbi:MAG: ATP-binding protein, partial [Nevskiales bacterium]